MMEDLYRILGVERNASADEIKKAKRIFALPSEQKKIRDMEIMQVLDEVPMTEIWNMENIKKRSLRLEEIDRRYGIID